MISIAQRLSKSPAMEMEILNRRLDQYDFNLRCCAPGIIVSFDSDKQTVSVQLAIKDLVIINKKDGGQLQSLQIPILGDVPIVIPRAGNFSITMPIKKGDECLVFFSDSCIDSWWQNGCKEDEKGNPVAQEPMCNRRHDLSDGFAILGTWSQPNVLENYNTEDIEIRNEDRDSLIRVKDDEIDVVVGNTSLNLTEDKITATVDSAEINITGDEAKLTLDNTEIDIIDNVVTIISQSIKLGTDDSLRKLIDERLINFYNAHTHTSGSSGSPTSAPLVPLVAATCATIQTEAV